MGGVRWQDMVSGEEIDKRCGLKVMQRRKKLKKMTVVWVCEKRDRG